MFRKMRRERQELPHDEALAILQNATSGVLALSGDEGYPYTVPISHSYCDCRLYFHSAVEGHKIDSIKRCGKASFCVISQDDVVPERYTTHYKSTVAFGRIRIVEDKHEKMEILRKIGIRFAPHNTEQMLSDEITGSFDRVAVLEMTIDHLTGKESRELMEMRNKA